MTRRKKKKEEKPTVSGGLKRGMKGTQELMSHSEGKFIILTVVTGLLYFIVIAPATCMKLEDAFPETGAGFFVSLAIFILWIVFISKMRKWMVGDEKKKKYEWTGFKDWIIQLITGLTKIGADVWRESREPEKPIVEKEERPKRRVTVTRKRTVIIQRKKKD